MKTDLMLFPMIMSAMTEGSRCVYNAANQNFTQ